jgi:hypothetical protein
MNTLMRYLQRIFVISVFTLLLAGAANADTIINLDARSNRFDSPFELFLDAGNYNVTPIGIADGGVYNASSLWSLTNCTDPSGCVRRNPTTFTGWLNTYVVNSVALGTVAVNGNALIPVAIRPPPPPFEPVFVINPGERWYVAMHEFVYPDNATAISSAGVLSSSFTLQTAATVGFSHLGSSGTLGDDRGGISLLLTPISAELDPLVKYDNFNAKKYNGCKYCINPKKWRGQERGDYNTEVLRAIKSKKAHLSHTSWGTTDSDAGRNSGKNRLTFNKRESADISGVCFTPRIKNYLIKSCAANNDHGHVRVRYLGNFYDTDNADEGDEDGLIYAGIEMIRHGNSGDAKAKFEISGWARESEGKDGDTEIWATDGDYGFTQPDLNFGTIKASKNKKAMCVGYDRASHEMVFSFGTDERRVNAADHGLPDFGDDVSAGMAWHSIEARTDVVNCTAGALRGSVDVDFDNVKVKQYVDPE